MNFKESIYWKIYGDIFTLHKQFSDPVDADEFWSELVAESNNIYKKYKDLAEGEFAKDLLLAVAAEIERNYRARTLNENATK